MNIQDQTGTIVSRVAVIGRYFRRKEETLQEFQTGMKGLSEVDKDELAVGTAKELNLVVVPNAPALT